jgi:hypothetical protein
MPKYLYWLVAFGLELEVRIDFETDSISEDYEKDNPCYVWLQLEACVEMLDLKRQASNHF